MGKLNDQANKYRSREQIGIRRKIKDKGFVQSLATIIYLYGEHCGRRISATAVAAVRMAGTPYPSR